MQTAGSTCIIDGRSVLSENCMQERVPSGYSDIVASAQQSPEEWLIYCHKGREHVYEKGFVLYHVPSDMIEILEDKDGARMVLDAMLSAGVQVVRRLPHHPPRWKFWRWFW